MKKGSLATYRCVFTDVLHFIVLLSRTDDGFWKMYRSSDGKHCEIHEGNTSLKVVVE
jgi:hypothetical protein